LDEAEVWHCGNSAALIGAARHRLVLARCTSRSAGNVYGGFTNTMNSRRFVKK
jgi:hypothetical protein